MKSLDCTLLCDGSSDRMLIPSIKWLLVQYFPETPFNFEYADIRRVSKNKSLSEKICLALDLFPCDILFIQRDTEKESIEKRKEEIQLGIESSNCELPHVVPVIPKRMSEAWLLFDERAIREASGNLNGRIKLELPRMNSIESLPDPKEDLLKLIKEASELNKRRLRSFSAHSAIHRLADCIENYSPLRTLDSFALLEKSIKNLDLDN